jgi:hypothetical protein
MTRQLIGLNRFLYVFNLTEKEKYIKTKSRLSNKGIITENFINNKLAFEIKLNRNGG